MTVIALALIASGFCRPDTVRARPESGTMQARLERLLAPAARVGEFSGTVLIRKQGRVVAAASYGSAIREFAVHNTPATRYLIGSVSKQFTAAAVLVLVERQRLSLDDHLSRWLPDFPGAAQITIRQLLTHRSGISRDLPGGPAALRLPRTPREMVDLIATDSLRFAPGSRQAYSNNAYRILAWLVETVSGEPFASFLMREVVRPAGLLETGALEAHTLVPGLALGYSPGFGPGGFGPASFADISNGVGPGSLYSTVADLARWGERFLRDGAVLPGIRKLILDGEGLGVAVDTSHGRRLFWHNGVYQGYTALLAVFPDDSLTIVYLGNTETSLSEGPLRDGLIDVAFGRDVPPLAAPPIGRAGLEHPVDWYVGVYHFFPGLDVTVTAGADALLLDGLPLEHEGGGVFYYRLKGSTVRFDAGRVRSAGMMWKDPSGEYRARRQEATTR